jgi:GAF domain-containing protein
MAPSSDRLADLFPRAVADVLHARDLDDALRRLVPLLRDDFDLWSTIVVSYSADAPHFTVVAKWSAAETLFEVGTEIAVDLTPGVRGIADRLLSGELSLTRSSEGTLGLADMIQRNEGILATLLIPLRSGDTVVGGLVLASSSESTFGTLDLVFFKRLGAAIEGQLAHLLTSPQQ